MKKNILIIDDSALMRRVMSDIIESDGRFVVKDYARDGLEGLELIIKNRFQYDAVIMDVNMPKMNGLEVLEELQNRNIAMKIVMVSTLVREGAVETITALERGAFDFVTKPESYIEVVGEKFKNKLITTLALATGIKEPERTESSQVVQKNISNILRRRGTSGSKLVVIACSTGGPKSLKEVIPMLPKDLDAPVLLVQHMPKGFTNSLAARLNELSRISVKEAEEGDILQKGMVYLAPGGSHMKVVHNKSGDYCVKLTDEPPRDGLRPCANITYESLCKSSYSRIICVIMTGMGSDGTKGISQLCKTNDVYVISQDEETSVVYGMPRTIAETGLSDEVVPLNKIAETITKNVGVLNNGR